MKISWNMTGYWVRTGTALFPVGMVLFLLEGRFGGRLVTLAAGIIWLAIIVIGVVCAGFALLYYAGLLKVTCPLCKRPAILISQGPYTYLRCDGCGDVHARGFFRTNYERR